MKNVKRLITLLIVLILAVSNITGCSSGSSSSSETPSSSESPAASEAPAASDDSAASSAEETVFRIGYMTEPPSLDPKDFNSTACTLVAYDCYDTLLNFNMDGTDVEPCLAESWEQKDDTTYVYHIRKGVKFSDGSDLTMEDVLYSLNRVRDKEYSMSYLFETVDSFETDDSAWTLTVHLKQPDATWKFVPATSPCTIIKKSVVEAEGDKYGTVDGSCIGTGPYMKSSWTSGSEIVLEKNPYYWGDPNTLDVSKVYFEVIADDTSRALAAQSGQLDYARNLTSETLSIYQNSPDLSLVNYPSTSAYFLALNCDKEPFNDENARRAFAYCIDKSTITKLIGGEYATESKGVIFTPTMFYMDSEAWQKADAEMPNYQQNYDKAKECLAQSAYPNGFTCNYYCTDSGVSQAEAIQKMVEPIGITLNIVTIQKSESFDVSYGYSLDENGKRLYDVYGTGWVSDYLDPLGYLKPHYHSSMLYAGGSNKAQYNCKEFDDLINESYLHTDDKERAALLIQAATVAAEDCPYVPLYYVDDTYVINKNFSYEEGPAFFWNFTVANVHKAK